MKILFLIMTILVSSCSAIVTKDVSIPKHAPKNFHPTGQVKYLNEGAGFVINHRREDAFKKMHDMCGGEYEVLYEGAANTSPSFYVSGDSIFSSSTQYVYIDFKCTSRDPASLKTQK